MNIIILYKTYIFILTFALGRIEKIVGVYSKKMINGSLP